jgi:hypothetical protein
MEFQGVGNQSRGKMFECFFSSGAEALDLMQGNEILNTSTIINLLLIARGTSTEIGEFESSVRVFSHHNDHTNDSEFTAHRLSPEATSP